MSGLVIIDEKIVRTGRKKKHSGTEKERAAKRVKAHRKTKQQERLEHIAVIDMESDPFDAEGNISVFPFAACLYSHNFDPIIIWDENQDRFIDKVIKAIMDLPDEYTIYAHNGSKFDFMFLMNKIRGKVGFKGRGIMSAKIGNHHLRDSYFIIPERLASYKKDDFDYEKMRKGKRNKHKKEILDYLLNDCIYLYEIVSEFLKRYGLKISIGQAALAELKKHYNVGCISEAADESLRKYFYGGRVQCLQGGGKFDGHYKMYDVNSMYPYAMSAFKHPISSNYNRRTKGGINENTVFLEIQCRNNGALVARDENGNTTTGVKRGTFFTTIYEYNTALELGLISNVKIKSYIDNETLSDFSNFVNPLYDARQRTKKLLKELPEGSREWQEVKKDDIFIKLLLNNAYGKFAQNPRKFRDYHITDFHEDPPEEYFEHSLIPKLMFEDTCIWAKPIKKMRFLNVGTSASITGAARSILMRAIHNAKDALYCDTDSLICRELENTELHPTKLGAWDLEEEFSSVIIGGKKLYAAEKYGQPGKYKIRSKGAQGLQWDDFIDMVRGETILTKAKAPTISVNGSQVYQTRNVKMTVDLNPAKGIE